ncbi:manganese transport system membrane protein MntB [Oxobacter pfennigii]|uniref:Manganese transport system membrane protein MntB n=1 Tax=Oxobacter pfennigii TaxID=36849 RepID=A0A0P8WZG7_9CLOT|nr:metal ABC transporter permease [Oxobacter pfennigii]KPU43871.1 manganese transport system membrane protein MntB [Oxobacter pfennigii]
MSPQFEIQVIAVIVAVACALPGVFLVLRRMSMMSDSITHTILLGIVLAFFMVHDLSSPLLILGAAVIGVITVWLTEMLGRTRLLAEDAAMGIVFPLLFSIAIILITRYAGAVHLDTDSVLLGELAFAPFDRMVIAGVDIGAKAIYTTGSLLLLNLAVIIIFFKELKVATFDPMLAAVLGFAPAFVHYGLMTLVSLTTVGAFQAVGSILVVAFMIGPPVTAYLLTDDLKRMLILSGLIGAVNGILGYQAAALFDVSIAGSMAVMTGMVFLLVFVFAPGRGFISALRRRKSQKIRFAKMILLFHLYNHEGTEHEVQEAGLDTIQTELHWDTAFTRNIMALLKKEECIEFTDNMVKLTDYGRLTSIHNYEALFSK